MQVKTIMAEHISVGEEDKALTDVNGYIKEVFDILKRETLRVRKEKQTLHAMANKLEHVHFAKTIKLNVGGQYFTTSLETLTKDSGSMLHAMFSKKFNTKPAEDGSYFIDRDGTHFRHILNYLRTGQVALPEDKVAYKELQTEAEFYQIQGILAMMKPKPKMKMKLRLKSKAPFNESVILNEEQRQKLVAWVDESPQSTESTYSLLYRASRDGWASTSFHARCDNKGPTFTVVLSGTNIFGGFTEESWTSIDEYKTSRNTFLFSLVNPSGFGPTKMPLRAEGRDYAIYCNGGYGPTFGSGFDLHVSNGANTNNMSISCLSSTYECPTYCCSASFMVGRQNFTVNDYEVFAYQKC